MTYADPNAARQPVTFDKGAIGQVGHKVTLTRDFGGGPHDFTVIVTGEAHDAETGKTYVPIADAAGATGSLEYDTYAHGSPCGWVIWDR